MAMLRKSRSMEKYAPAEYLVWDYTWCVLTDSTPAPSAVEDRIEHFIARTRVALQATKGRWFSDQISLLEIPPEVHAYYRTGEERRHQEQERFHALSSEQQGMEVQHLLLGLRKDTSFVAVGVRGLPDSMGIPEHPTIHKIPALQELIARAGSGSRKK
jgi:hypothetical protein